VYGLGEKVSCVCVGEREIVKVRVFIYDVGRWGIVLHDPDVLFRRCYFIGAVVTLLNITNKIRALQDPVVSCSGSLVTCIFIKRTNRCRAVVNSYVPNFDGVRRVGRYAESLGPLRVPSVVNTIQRTVNALSLK
jgi:hypothetical protein